MVGALSALVALVLALAGCGGDDSTSTSTSTPAATGIKLTELGNFDAPLYVTQPPGESEDLFVVEQGGTIQQLAPDGETNTFLDISDEISSGGERGLLSVAFSPDYEQAGLFYVDYTDLEGDTRVVEYAAPGGRVDPASKRTVLRVDQPAPNHNGGLLLFGPDDELYIGLGDGGPGDDLNRTALDLNSLLGKILRIHPRPGGPTPYTIPPDNPFAGQGESVRGEIYALGLRNPWRFSFDPQSGDLTIGDVGQDAQEEVDVVSAEQAAGANFGWSAFEGDAQFNSDQDAPDAIAPALVASHDDGNCSITGGLTVRDPDLPELEGRYLYADLCLGELRSFTPEPGRPARDDAALGMSIEAPSSFGTDNAGNVYVASISGPVYRLDAGGRSG